MHITLSSQLSKPRHVILDDAIVNDTDMPYSERSTTFDDSWGKLDMDEMWFNGLGICRCKFDLQSPCSMDIGSDVLGCVMSFMLKGNARLNTPNQSAIIEDGNYYSCYSPVTRHQLDLSKSATIFTVCFAKPAIDKLFYGLPQGRQADFADELIIGEYRSTSLEPLITDIIKASQTTPVKRIYLEAKLLELLSLQLEQEPGQNEDHGFNEADTKRLHEAKNIVAQNLQTPCSLIELARKTGLNDFKLKKGFKALFGNTVFGYLNELRMEKAYALLKNNTSVGDVAEIIGYKNAQHFTVAFKKKFGLLPSQVNNTSAKHK